MSSMPNGAITRTQFDAARNQFKDRFLVNGTTVVTEVLQHFKYSDLADLVAVIEQPYRLVIVHYGLEEQKMRYGFSFTFGTRIAGTDSYVYTKQHHASHLLTPAGFVPIPEAAWDALRKSYEETMMTKRDSGPFEKLVEVDALRTVLPWEAELQPLYVDNVSQSPEDYRMMVESMSRFHDEEVGEDGAKSLKGFRHDIGFYMEELQGQDWVRLLGDAVESAPYRNRAADFGNLCPVLCGTYTEV